jgi:7-cyano-7-deazaguanine reductase
MPRKPLPSLTYLGRPTAAPTTPDEAVLDRVPNANNDAPYVVRFSAPEFTVPGAVTGQPDFAHLVIDYVPKAWLIESKEPIAKLSENLRVGHVEPAVWAHCGRHEVDFELRPPFSGEF